MKGTGRQEPYIVAIETDETMHYHIYIQYDCLLSMHTLGDALADLICTFFFDIAYPKLEYALLIFFQHFVLGLKDNQKIPPSVSSLCFSLSS